MNFAFKIELAKKYRRVNLYTIRIKNSSDTEFEKFLKNPEIMRHKDFDKLTGRLDTILNRYGCEDNFFRYASKPTDPVSELAYGKLRLYCCVWSKGILILGTGGIKTTRTYQEDPELNKYVQELIYVSKRLEERIREKEVIIDREGFFIGNLTFDEEI